MKFLSIISIMAIGAVIAVGCATTAQTTPQLNQAQQAYSQARNDPMVSQHAPVPLYEAGQALEKAENAKSEAERRHYAYLAQTKVELAQTRAAEKAAENQLAQLRAQQEEMLLTARTQELERAQQEARQAREELRTYRSAQQEQELTQARAELQELRQEMQNMQAEQTWRGILLTFGDVLFAYDKTELKPGAERSIRQLADFLKDHPDRRVIIEGHTDNRGPEAYNQQLSQKRAQAVADILMAQGIGSDRITTRGLGENYPIAPNTNVTGRQENRRVEIIIPTPGQSGERPSTPSGT